MKRAEIAYIANIRPKRMDVLKERGQLPFDMPESGKFTPDHAFRLRLMLDLIGGEDDGLGGLPPSSAAPLVAEALRKCPMHPLQQITPIHWWAGVVVLERKFEDSEGEVVTERWAITYAGELEQFAAWLEDARTFEAKGSGGQSIRGRHVAVRVFLANMTHAARFVQDRAEEIGIDPFAVGQPEADT